MKGGPLAQVPDVCRHGLLSSQLLGALDPRSAVPGDKSGLAACPSREMHREVWHIFLHRLTQGLLAGNEEV